MKRGKESTIIRRPSVGAHFNSEVLDFFTRVRIDKRGGRIPDRGAIRKMRKDKGDVDGKESLWRSMLIEVAIYIYILNL